MKVIKRLDAPKGKKDKGSGYLCPDCKEDLGIDVSVYFRDPFKNVVDIACNFCRAEIRITKLKNKIEIELVEKGPAIIEEKKAKWINSGYNVEE